MQCIPILHIASVPESILSTSQGLFVCLFVCLWD